MSGNEPAFLLKLLGPPRVEAPGGVRVKGIPGLGFGLLAYLSLDAKRHTREHLARLIWPRSPLPNARHSLRQLLTTMRKVLPGVLLADEDYVRVGEAGLSVDVHTFEHEIRWGRPESALQLCRGSFMEDWGRGVSWELEEWIDGRRNRIHRLLRTSVSEGAKAYLATGRPKAAVSLVEKALALIPNQDELPLLLAQALASSGRVPEAEAALMEVEIKAGDARLQEARDEMERWRVVGPHPALRFVRPVDA